MQLARAAAVPLYLEDKAGAAVGVGHQAPAVPHLIPSTGPGSWFALVAGTRVEMVVVHAGDSVIVAPGAGFPQAD